MLRAGLFRISDTLVMKTNVSLHGEWPTYASATVDQKGTWLVWAGRQRPKTMLQIGHRDQTTERDIRSTSNRSVLMVFRQRR